MRLVDVGVAYELAMSRNKLRALLRDASFEVRFWDSGGGQTRRLELEGEADLGFQRQMQAHIRGAIEEAIADIENRLRGMSVDF